MTQHPKSQFNNAEIAVQERVGVADMVAQYSKGFIRGAMPQQHRDFFSQLPFVILGLVDKQGYPWAMPIFGQQGFISSPSDTQLIINALPSLSQSLSLDFKPGQKIGLLGIQLSSRRRNRMNGVIASIGKDGFSINVEQSFGNCPQYIQTRELTWQTDDLVASDYRHIKAAQYIDSLSKEFIEQADTFFISSRTKNFDKDSRSGIDASHRGGRPGFVKVEGNSLYFPDFSGNMFFNTLGNIQSDNRVGLFFPDYSTGNAIFITGHASILWEGPAIDQFKGAERVIRIDALKTVNIPRFMPMRGELIELSPVLDETGSWGELPRKEAVDYHVFSLTDKQKESDTITSFYFSSRSQQPISHYLPGQFLPVQLNIPGKDKPVQRSYTLSRAAANNSYRISVKREEQGLISTFLHDQVNIGDEIYVGEPMGQFIVQKSAHAIVFISAGVGITPMIAMLEGVINELKEGMTPRPVWFIHGTQNSQTQAFNKQLNELACEYDWLTVHTVFSQPLASDKVGRTHHSEGRISIDLLKALLPFDQYNFYLCGPEGFMRAMYTGLANIGVDKNNIFYEFFGEGSIEAVDELAVPVADTAMVTFAKTNVSTEWTSDDGSLLEFAEEKGLTPAYGCRLGNCGACACQLISGEVSYSKKISRDALPEGEVLICCAKPAKDSAEVIINI